MKKTFYFLITLLILSTNSSSNCAFLGAKVGFSATNIYNLRYLGQDVVLGRSTSNDNHAVLLDYSLSYGTFINKNNAWGIQLGGRLWYFNDSDIDVSELDHIINLGPFYRYYLDISKKISFFTHCYMNISTTNVNFRNSQNHLRISNSNYQIMAGAQPGLSYNLNNSFNIEAGIGNLEYSYIISDGNAENFSVFSLDLNTISLSLLYKF